jgi:hypothetical protein
MPLRDHQPLILEEFNGWWERGETDTVPIDHFDECNNVKYIHGGFETRDGIDLYSAVNNPVRMYNYVMQTGDSLLVLNNQGQIYHVVNRTTIYGPILTIPEMEDFGFVAIAGRAYITPFHTTTDPNGFKYQVGLPGDFVYVYKGDGTNARKAAGRGPTNGGTLSFSAFNSSVEGSVTKGIHVIGVLAGSNYGFAVVDSPGEHQIRVHNMPVGMAKTIFSTKAIDPKDYNATISSYTYYEVKAITDITVKDISIDFSDGQLTNSIGVTPPTTTALLAQNTNNDGYSDAGFHIFAIVYETDTGFLTAPGPEIFATLTTVDMKKSIKISNIPVSPDSFVIARHILSTKVIPDFNGDLKGYQFFFVSGGYIDNNTATEKEVSFYDADLLEDASHLLDTLSEIPAGVGLGLYHGRMIVYTTSEDISLVGVSARGEPESINLITGILIVTLDGQPITNAQEYRDILYVFKSTKTVAFTDSGEDPVDWPSVMLDQGIGASVHGISKVLDSDGVNVDFLLVMNYAGVFQFNGAYIRPELTWKIYDFWSSLIRDNFKFFQIMNDTLNQLIYISFNNMKVLHGNYENGLNSKDIRWGMWTFDTRMSTIALIENDKFIMGSGALPATARLHQSPAVKPQKLKGRTW